MLSRTHSLNKVFVNFYTVGNASKYGKFIIIWCRPNACKWSPKDTEPWKSVNFLTDIYVNIQRMLKVRAVPSSYSSSEPSQTLRSLNRFRAEITGSPGEQSKKKTWGLLDNKERYRQKLVTFTKSHPLDIHCQGNAQPHTKVGGALIHGRNGNYSSGVSFEFLLNIPSPKTFIKAESMKAAWGKRINGLWSEKIAKGGHSILDIWGHGPSASLGYDSVSNRSTIP